LAKNIETPSFNLRCLRDFAGAITAQVSFVRIRETTKSTWLRFAVGREEQTVEMPAGGTAFSYGGYGTHASGSLNLKGPFRAGALLPITIEASNSIGFGGSILRGYDTDFRPAFEVLRVSKT
jgi:hypothetical protein